MSYDHNGGQIFSPDPSKTTLVGKDREISHRNKRKSLQRGGISVCSAVLDYATLLILMICVLQHSFHACAVLQLFSPTDPSQRQT